MRKSTLFSCLALSFGFFATGASAQKYATLIFDKTGSMTVIRADGRSRCQYGKELFLTSVAEAFKGAGTYLNVKVFGGPGELSSISGGFVNLTGLKTDEGPGKVFFDGIQQQVNALSCNSTSTALGDALCDSMDELRSYSPTTTTLLRLAVVTDAGENNSQRCSGMSGTPPTYLTNYIIPRLFSPAPLITFKVAILQNPINGGNVSARIQSSQPDVPSYEIFDTNSTVSTVSTVAESGNSLQLAATTPVYSSEVQGLILAAQASGGGAIVISDNEVCTSNCDPLSQGSSDDDDWGGAW